uniref:NACHT domain-containing protein n=1 Tax=Bionectria ochroleuca TaxID=29856 RepID=A0A8H7NI08_BIOOC
MPRDYDDTCMPTADTPRRKLANADYTIGWICAIKLEHVAAAVFLDEKDEEPEYVLPREYGISSATSVARDMLHTFPNIRIGLMVGIGGGAPSKKHDIRLGDIVVSAPHHGNSGVFQYDFGKTIQDREFHVTKVLDQPPMVLRTAIHGLETEYEIEGHQFDMTIDYILKGNERLQHKYKRPEPNSDKLYRSDVVHPPEYDSDCVAACGDSPSKLIARRQRRKGEDNPAIHYGLIASANQLMKDASVRDRIAAENNVLCFEMEAAGLMNHFPCLVIRGICDYSDTHKNDIWQGYAAMAAAAYAKDLLYKIAPSKVEGERRLGELIQSVSERVDDVHQLASETRDTTKLIQDGNYLNKIRNWLAPPDPSTNLNQARSMHYRGTGQWFLNSNAYSGWKKEKNSFLWLNGIPGCGKTVLSSTIVTDLDPANSNPRVLYFFFNFNDVEKRSLENAIRSLIFQLYAKHIIVRSEVDAVYSSFGDGTRQPDAPALDQLLRRIMQKSEEIYLILDALDESERHSGSYSPKSLSLLGWIKSLHNESTNIHILVTSRPEQDIMASFNGWADTDKIIQLQTVDLIAVDLSGQPAFTPDNRMPVPEEIIQYCSSLVALTHKGKRAEIQLAHFSVKEYLLSDRLEPSLAKELGEIPAKASIVDVCLSYLLSVHKSCSPQKAKKKYYLAEFSARYWMKHAKDVELFNKAILPSVEEYILCQNAFQFGCQLYDPDEFDDPGEFDDPDEFDDSDEFDGSDESDDPEELEVGGNQVLYYASLWGLLYSSTFLLQNDVKAQGGYDNALQAASEGGHLEIAQMLIQNGADINAQGGKYGNALQAASAEGHREIAKLLIENGASVNSQGGRYSNALQAASERGHREIAKLLIENGAGVNAQGGVDGNALQAASVYGHPEIAKLLIENGADVKAQGGYYGNALQAASVYGHREIAELLIEKGADVNAQGADANAQGRYGNALHAASVRGHREIAELLIENGADINAQGGYYGNALQAASERGHREIAELLIRKGAKQKRSLSDQ